MSTTGLTMPAAEATPAAPLQAVMRERLGDPTARLVDLHAEPISGGGYSGNPLYRVRVAWAGGGPGAESGSATWVLKRWLPGGHGHRLLGVDRPLEALAWEWGILRPGSMPPGIVVPTRSVHLDSSGDAAWIVMDDVSGDLAEYKIG